MLQHADIYLILDLSAWQLQLLPCLKDDIDMSEKMPPEILLLKILNLRAFHLAKMFYGIEK